jgi:phosphoglycolate phosphatase-like HAD superfamily hydrolase
VRRLVLFDIDGTLVRDGGVSREAFTAALRRVYGYDGDLTRYDFSGRTDPQIAHMILRDFGLEEQEIESRFDALWADYLDGLARGASAERIRDLPGVRTLLDALRAREDVVLALLTGNIEPGARLKLAPPALNDYFPFGAFGSDSPRREELPPIAVERASRALGHRFEGRDVVIIGDSIWDIRCGTPHGATTIAVASGKTAAERLQAENPDHFFPSCEETGAILRAILDGAA